MRSQEWPPRGAVPRGLVAEEERPWWWPGTFEPGVYEVDLRPMWEEINAHRPLSARGRLKLKLAEFVDDEWVEELLRKGSL